MDPWLIYFVTYNSLFSDASYLELGIWPGRLHAGSNYYLLMSLNKSHVAAQCISVSMIADKHALTL